MSLLTSIYSSILKIIVSDFQQLLFRGSTLQTQHYLDFDYHNYKVPFVISCPICILICSMYGSSSFYKEGRAHCNCIYSLISGQPIIVVGTLQQTQ